MCSTYLACTRNLFDTTQIYNFFKKNKFNIVKKPAEAGVIIINTCGFDQIKENNSLKIINHYFKNYPNKKIIVCGCLPPINTSLGENFKGIVTIGPKEYKKFNEIFDHEEPIQEIKTNRLDSHFLNNKEKRDSLDSNKGYHIGICAGCLNNCSYCVEKKAKGYVVSKPMEDVVLEFINGIRAGFSNINLLAEDCGSYGVDINTNFAKLLNELYKFENENFKLNIHFFEPKRLIELYPEINKGIIRDKISYICIPIESCSQRILKLMNRHYDVREVLKIIIDIRKLNPNIQLTTHIIYGFPS